MSRRVSAQGVSGHRNCPQATKGLPAGGHLDCQPVVGNTGRSSSVREGVACRPRRVYTPVEFAYEWHGAEFSRVSWGPTGWKGGNSVRSQSSGLASGIELIRVAKGDCIAEADNEAFVSEPGHQDAVRPLLPGALDHPVDRRRDAAVHGGPVADLDFDGFYILYVHNLLTLLGRIGRAGLLV